MPPGPPVSRAPGGNGLQVRRVRLGPAGARGTDGAPGRDAKVSCKLSRSGKKAKVKCTVTYARASAVLTAKLRVGGRTVTTRKVRIRDGRGTTSFRLKRGKHYRVVLS